MDQRTDEAKLYELSEPQQNPDKVEYLMLAVSGEHGFDRLVQVKLTEPLKTDAAFFHLLRREYWKHRERYYGINPFWREVKAIHFVEFETLQPLLSQQTIRIVEFDKLPEPAQVGWTRTVVPEFGPQWPQNMAIYFKYPALAGESQEACLFPEVPRKLDAEIPRRLGETGWGLAYIEGTKWTLDDVALVGCLMVTLLVAMLFVFLLLDSLSARHLSTADMVIPVLRRMVWM